MAATSHRGEVIVVDNNSTDDTATLAQNHGARVVFEPVNQISRARNKGAEAAKGDYLIFVDSDTSISAGLLGQALALLGEKKAIGGGSLMTSDEGMNKGIALWNWVSQTLNLAAGSFIFVTRKAFEASGGFSTKLYAGEEINFSKKIKKIGRAKKLPFVIIKDFPVVTSMRKVHWFSKWQIFWMWFLIFVFPIALYNPKFLPFWYQRPPRK